MAPRNTDHTNSKCFFSWRTYRVYSCSPLSRQVSKQKRTVLKNTHAYMKPHRCCTSLSVTFILAVLSILLAASLIFLRNLLQKRAGSEIPSETFFCFITRTPTEERQENRATDFLEERQENRTSCSAAGAIRYTNT